MKKIDTIVCHNVMGVQTICIAKRYLEMTMEKNDRTEPNRIESCSFAVPAYNQIQMNYEFPIAK